MDPALHVFETLAQDSTLNPVGVDRWGKVFGVNPYHQGPSPMLKNPITDDPLEEPVWTRDEKVGCEIGTTMDTTPENLVELSVVLERQSGAFYQM